MAEVEGSTGEENPFSGLGDSVSLWMSPDEVGAEARQRARNHLEAYNYIGDAPTVDDPDTADINTYVDAVVAQHPFEHKMLVDRYERAVRAEESAPMAIAARAARQDANRRARRNAASPYSTAPLRSTRHGVRFAEHPAASTWPQAGSGGGISKPISDDGFEEDVLFVLLQRDKKLRDELAREAEVEAWVQDVLNASP